MISECVKPEGKEFSTETWHLTFRKAYLGCEDHMLPTGKPLSMPRSTTDLDVAEFSDYFDRVQAFAANRGVYLADHGVNA